MKPFKAKIVNQILKITPVKEIKTGEKVVGSLKKMYRNYFLLSTLVSEFEKRNAQWMEKKK